MGYEAPSTLKKQCDILDESLYQIINYMYSTTIDNDRGQVPINRPE